jgi:hypothetical protein
VRGVRLVLVVALAGLLLLPPAAASAARPKNCGDGRGDLANHILDITVRNTTCREARRVVKNLRRCRDLCRGWSSRGRAGFYICRVEQAALFQSKVGCVRGRRRVSWQTFS